MKRALGKKGVEVQFNWIFILIVGGLIIFLVTKMVSFQKESSESLASSAVRSRMQSILASAISNSDLSSKVNVQAKQMGYDCSGLYIGELGASRRLGLGTAFAPAEIRSSGGNIILRSQPWLMPFSAGNFLYITSPEVQYVFLENPDYEDIIDELYSVLPENESKTMIEPGGELAEMLKRRNYNLRIVLFGNSPDEEGISDILNDEKVSILSVYPENKASFGGYDFNAGKIEFYSNKKKSGETSYYLGTASLIAAIYSDEISSYECGMDRALDRLIGISGIYMESAGRMSESYKTNEMCNRLLGASITALSAFRDSSREIKNAGISGIGQSAIIALSGKMRAIDAQNERLVRFSCPPIY